MSALGDHAARLLGTEILRTERLHGGDLSEVVRLHTPDGTMIAKAGTGAEANMLRAIAASGAPAPQVVLAEEGILILEDLGPDDGLSAAWGDLGSVLKRLHDTTGEGYGWPEDHAFGPVPIPNAPTAG